MSKHGSRVLITFSGRAYDATTERMFDALKFGAHAVRVYDDRWLMTQHRQFMEDNKFLWETPKKFGFGWCCWKALIIADAMNWLLRTLHPVCADASTVLYVDADTYPIADLTPIFQFAERDGICLFESQGNPNKRFTRRDCCVAMGLDEEKHWNARHACGRFSAFKVGDYRAWQFLCEWLTYSVNPMCQSLEPSKYTAEFPEFARHSNEQSVLTLLASKYGIPLHREACQFGWPAQPGCGQPEDKYPQLFHQEYCTGDRGDLSGSRFRNV